MLKGWLVGLWCLMPLPTIFQLNRGKKAPTKTLDNKEMAE